MTRSVSITLALGLVLLAAAPARTQNLVFPLTAAAGVTTSNKPVLDVTQTWNGVDAGIPFTALRIGITDTMSHASRSRLLEMRVNGAEVFQVRKSGEIVISNAAGTSVGGLKPGGNLGEMALTSQLHPWTGLPAEVIRYYWEAGMVGQAAVIRGMGTNRFSIESAGAIVHVAQNSLYEWEGFGSSTINMIGYQAGSSNGRPINFLNAGQTGEHATPLYATNVLSQVGTIQEWRDGRSGSTTTTVAAVEADGTFQAKALVLNDVPTSQPATAGAVWNDGGFLRLGGGSGGASHPVAYTWNGAAGGDAVLSGAGTGSLSIESPAALLLQSATGQMAFKAGTGVPRVNIVGYEDDTSLGVPINFTNEGQDTAQPSHALEVTNVHAGVSDIIRFNDARGGSPVTVASVSADGALTATALTLTGLPTVDPASTGEVWSDAGVLKLSGAPAGFSEVVTAYWNGTAGGDAVLGSLGAGSLAIESPLALILQSDTGQMELTAGLGLPRVDIVAHEQGSSLGVPVNFTNQGQDAAQPIHALEVTNAHAGVADIILFNDARGGSPVTVASVSADGAVTASALNLTNLPISDPASAGQVWNDGGLLKLSGSSGGSQALSYAWDGAAGGDAVVSGLGTGSLTIESQSALILQSDTGQMALTAGLGLRRIDLVGHEESSGLGVPINITNEGQDAAQPSHALEVTNAHAGVADIIRFNDARGGSPVTVASVSADGAVTAAALTLTDLPISDPASSGQVWNDGGLLKLSGSSGGSQALSYAWNGAAGGDAVLSGLGTGSLTIESQSALILQSETGQMEFAAGAGTPRVDIVGHEQGSSLGVAVNFTNQGQDLAQQSHALEVTNVHAGVGDIIRFNDARGGSPVTVASVSADGAVTATALTLTSLPTTDPASAGGVWSDDGVLKLSGATATAQPLSYAWDGTAGGDAV